MIATFFALLVGHALADYPLQGDFLARAKNHKAPIAGVPWYQALGAHALIHGGMVWAITGVWWMGLLEVASHSWIDWSKCDGRISFNTDQLLHVFWKATYVLMLWELS